MCIRDSYQTVTLHHSSFSTCIFGILASQIGYDEEAYKYFSQSARMDLDDMHLSLIHILVEKGGQTINYNNISHIVGIGRVVD